jgi:hypothetical protein
VRPLIARRLDYLTALFAALTKRDTLRLARFFGMTLPAALISFDSAALTAGSIAALSFDSIAFAAFLTIVRVAFLRDMFTLRLFSVTRTRFFADLWFANFYAFVCLLAGILY